MLGTRHTKAPRLRLKNVVVQGLTHPMKEEKIGLIPGARARLKIYWEIARILADGKEPEE